MEAGHVPWVVMVHSIGGDRAYIGEHPLANVWREFYGRVNPPEFSWTVRANHANQVVNLRGV